MKHATQTTLKTLLCASVSMVLLTGNAALADPPNGNWGDHGDHGGQNHGDHDDRNNRPMPPLARVPTPSAPAAPAASAPQARHDWRSGDNHNWHNDNGHDWQQHRDNDNWHRDDHKSHTNIVVNFGAPRPVPRYYAPAPRYVPVSYGRRAYPTYYYSEYYTQRAIPVEPEQPYVEVRCGDQPITGTIVGGLAGGLIGNQFGHGSGRTAATIGGALLGAIIGQSVDQADESCAYQALEYAQPNTQVVWANPNDSYSYTVIPGPVTDEGGGRYCREYQAKILVGGQVQNGYGTACRQPDGTWQVEN